MNTPVGLHHHHDGQSDQIDWLHATSAVQNTLQERAHTLTNDPRLSNPQLLSKQSLCNRTRTIFLELEQHKLRSRSNDTSILKIKQSFWRPPIMSSHSKGPPRKSAVKKLQKHLLTAKISASQFHQTRMWSHCFRRSNCDRTSHAVYTQHTQNKQCLCRPEQQGRRDVLVSSKCPQRTLKENLICTLKWWGQIRFMTCETDCLGLRYITWSVPQVLRLIHKTWFKNVL